MSTIADICGDTMFAQRSKTEPSARVWPLFPFARIAWLIVQLDAATCQTYHPPNPRGQNTLPVPLMSFLSPYKGLALWSQRPRGEPEARTSAKATCCCLPAEGRDACSLISTHRRVCTAEHPPLPPQAPLTLAALSTTCKTDVFRPVQTIKSDF